MTRDIIDINDFTILVEEAQASKPTVDSCFFDEPLIGNSTNSEITNDIETILGRKPKDFSQYVKETAATGVWN